MSRPLEVYTLTDSDDDVEQLCWVIMLGIETAMAAEVISPESYSSLRAYAKAESERITRAKGQAPAKRAVDFLAPFRASKHWPFWSTLEPEQVVRWTGTKYQTYFVVTGTIVDRPDEDTTSHDRSRPASGWVQLRRHTGKTFWAHLTHIREHVA